MDQPVVLIKAFEMLQAVCGKREREIMERKGKG
jgi:hypothetical protein